MNISVVSKNIVSKNTVSKKVVRDLAEKAFHCHRISGYGDSEYSDQYQIVYQGKPRHLSLEEAQFFLADLLGH